MIIKQQEQETSKCKTVNKILKCQPPEPVLMPWRQEQETNLRSGRLLLYSGVQPAVEQLLLAMHLLQEPLGLNQRPSIPAHPSSEP